MKVETVTKRPMEFEKVRCGTVFTCNGKTYMKVCNSGSHVAADLETGNIIIPNSSEYKECYIYPRATIKLNGEFSKTP